MALRIGINALYLIPGGVGGTEIYLEFLLRSLARIDDTGEYFVFLNRETSDSFVPVSPRFRPVRCGVHATLRPARILFEQLRMPRLLTNRRIDVLLNPGFTGPVLTDCPQVTVFHDLQHRKHPEFFRVWELPFWRILLAASAARSAKLIAISGNTARDLAEMYPGATAKMAIIPHGVDPAFFEIGSERRGGGADLSRPFILAVSTLHRHKNLDRALEAFRRFRTHHPEYRFVIAGLRGSAAAHLENLVRKLGLADDVEFTGWISRSELYSLFRSADAFFAPSVFEGFGMPLVEAMAAGIPCACSSIPAFCEIDDGAAQRFDPHSVEAMYSAMETITQDEAFRLRAITNGSRRAAEFDWNRAAEATLRELRAAAVR